MDGDYIPSTNGGSQDPLNMSGDTLGDTDCNSADPATGGSTSQQFLSGTTADIEQGDTTNNDASDNDEDPVPDPTSFEQLNPIVTPQSLGIPNPNSPKRPVLILPSRHNRNSSPRINLSALHRPSNANSNTPATPTTIANVAPPPPRPLLPDSERTNDKAEADDMPSITTEEWICDAEWNDLDPQWTSLLPNRSLFVPNTRSNSFYNPTNPWQTYYWLIGQLRSKLNRFMVASGGNVETSMRNCFIGMFLAAAHGSSSPHNIDTTAFGNYTISLLCTSLKGRRLRGRIRSKSYASYGLDRANALSKFPSRRIHRIPGRFIIDLSKSQSNPARRIDANQYMQAVGTFRASNNYQIDETCLQSCIDSLNLPSSDTQHPSSSRKRSPPNPDFSGQTEPTTPVRKRARKNSNSNSNSAVPSMSSLGASYATGILPATNDTSEFDILLRSRANTVPTAQNTPGQHGHTAGQHERNTAQTTAGQSEHTTPGAPSSHDGEWIGNDVPTTASPTTATRAAGSLFATAWNVRDHFGAEHLAGAIATLSNELSYPDDMDFSHIAQLLERIVGFAVWMLQDLVNLCVTIPREQLANKQSRWAKIADNGIIWLISLGATADAPFWRNLVYSLLHLRPPTRVTPEDARNCFRKFTSLRISEKMACPESCLLSWPQFMKPFGAELDHDILQTLLSFWTARHQSSCIWRVNPESRAWFRATPSAPTPNTTRQPPQAPSIDNILAMAGAIGDDDCKVDTTSLVTSLPDNSVPATTQSRNHNAPQQVSWNINEDNNTPPPAPRPNLQRSQRSGTNASLPAAAPRHSAPSNSHQRVARLRGGNPAPTGVPAASHPAPSQPIVYHDDEDGKQQTLGNPATAHVPRSHNQGAGSAPNMRTIPTNILTSAIDTAATTLNPRNDNPYRENIMRIPYRVEEGLELQLLRGRDPAVFLATVALGRDFSSTAATAATTQLSHALNLGNRPAALQLEGIVSHLLLFTLRFYTGYALTSPYISSPFLGRLTPATTVSILCLLCAVSGRQDYYWHLSSLILCMETV